MSDQQQQGINASSYNPLEWWGVTDGERTWPTARAMASRSVLDGAGLLAASNDAVQAVRNGNAQAGIQQLQDIRAQLGQQVLAEQDPQRQVYAQNALRNIDRTINEAARVQQVRAADEKFRAQKDEYNRQRIRNAVDGTPITVENPGNEMLHNVGNWFGRLGQDVKANLVPYFYDEWGNPESSNYMAAMQQTQQTQQTQPAASQPTLGALTSFATNVGNTALQPMANTTTAATSIANAAIAAGKSAGTPAPTKEADKATASSSTEETPIRQQTQVAQQTAPQARRAGTATGLHYETLPDGGYRYGDQVTDPNGYQSTFMPQVNVARNPMQQIAWNNLMRQANASYDQNRAATMQEQARAGVLAAQADPATYQLADQYAQTMGLNAQEALNLATTERARAMGMWGAAGMSTAPTQQSLDTAAQRNVGMGAVYGVDTPTAVSSMGYSGVNGMRGMTFNDDGTVNVDLGGGRTATGISGDTMTRMLAAGMNPQQAAQAAVNQAAQQATIQARIANSSYGGDSQSGLPTSNTNKVTSYANQVTGQSDRETRKAGAGKPADKLGNM